MAEGINIVIPMGGIGSRFTKDGYRFPKPLVNIVGRPMLFWLLDRLTGVTACDTIYIAVMSHINTQFGMMQRLRNEYPQLHFVEVLLSFETRGAAETLFCVLQAMTAAHMARRTISLDCDTIYFEPIIERFKALAEGESATFYFEAPAGGKPVFSYITMEEDNNNSNSNSTTPPRVTDVKEKVPISTHANTGAYAFSSATLLHHYCVLVLDAAVGAIGEYYTTSIIQVMLQQHCCFRALLVQQQQFACVGTPEQLTTFIHRLKARDEVSALATAATQQQQPPAAIGSAASGSSFKKMRFCFDLDNTLVTYPTIPKDYSSCLPKHNNILLLQQLHSAGHHIIIQTARRMKTHRGNVGAVVADIGLITINSLAQHGIPYDELIFGKPHADVYVDDLAVHALLDTNKEIGWTTAATAAAEAAAAAAVNVGIKGFVQPRHFNTLVEVNNRIVKSAATGNSNSSSSGSISSIEGEIYFYQHVPTDVADMFPKLFAVDVNIVEDNNNSSSSSVSISSLTLEKIVGVTYSHLYINRCLTAGRLFKLLLAVKRLHQSSGIVMPSVTATATATSSSTATTAAVVPVDSSSSSCSNSNSTAPVDIYLNYTAKIRSRYTAHHALYAALDVAATVTTTTTTTTATTTGSTTTTATVTAPSSALLLERLCTLLSAYQQQRRAVHSNVIHGDPVFSNALLTAAGVVVLLDARGSIGSTLTLQGDVLYDLGKIYQSLCGYDHIIHDRTPMTAEDQQQQQQLLLAFEDFVRVQYAAAGVKLQDVRLVASALFFSLIPLHNNNSHQLQCLAKAHELAEGL